MRRLIFADTRKKSNITQREMERRLSWPVGAMGAYEDGRIQIIEAQENQLDDLLEVLRAEKVNDAHREEMATI